MKLVIIDRDGVVSRDPDGRTVRADDWRAVPGALDAIARLNHAGYQVVMMADCGPLARGACDMTTLNALHARILSDIVEHGGAVDAVLFVPPADQPGRTLAAAGALEALLERLGVAAAETRVVSDSRHELNAAHAAGCRPILVLSGHGRRTLEGGELPPDTLVRVDLCAVAAELDA